MCYISYKYLFIVIHMLYILHRCYLLLYICYISYIDVIHCYTYVTYVIHALYMVCICFTYICTAMWFGPSRHRIKLQWKIWLFFWKFHFKMCVFFFSFLLVFFISFLSWKLSDPFYFLTSFKRKLDALKCKCIACPF